MNTPRINRWMAIAAVTATLFNATGALGKDVLLVDAGQAPDPRQVAAVFNRMVAEPMKLRGIRVLNTAGNVAAAQATARVHCPPVAPARPAAYKVRGVRLPSDAKPAGPAVGPTEAAAPTEDCHEAFTDTAVAIPAAVVASPSPAARNPESIALMVPFRFNSHQIADEATTQLDAMAEGIKLAGPDVRIIIEGHTDAAGTDQYNLILSYLRASAVRDYLVREHGLSARNLRPVGMGKRAPLNAQDPGAPENRRVEFRVEQS